MSKISNKILTEIVEVEFNGDYFAMVEEYHNQGICLECGAINDGVEPDAQKYTCCECDQNAVSGIEFALLEL